MAGAIDLFVPTCKADLDQATILFQSMSRFVADDVFASVTVGAVDDEASFEAIRNLPTAKFQDRTRYLRLGELGVPEPRLDGWVVQQAAKLAFARHVRTDFYAVLDSKNIARVPIELDDLVKDGRAAAYLEDAAMKPSVWRDAAWALDHRGFDRSRRRQVLSVFTPVLLHTESVLEMVDFLERRFEQTISEFLRARCTMTASTLGRVMIRAGIRRAVTEFPLYYVYLDKVGRLDKHFLSPGLLQQPYGWWAQTAEQRSALCSTILGSDPEGLFGGIHRSAWRLMSEQERIAVRAFAGISSESD